jgi:hypothetical protein
MPQYTPSTTIKKSCGKISKTFGDIRKKLHGRKTRQPSPALSRKSIEMYVCSYPRTGNFSDKFYVRSVCQ